MVWWNDRLVEVEVDMTLEQTRHNLLHSVAWYRDRKELLIQQMSDIKEEQLVVWYYSTSTCPPLSDQRI